MQQGDPLGKPLIDVRKRHGFHTVNRQQVAAIFVTCEILQANLTIRHALGMRLSGTYRPEVFLFLCHVLGCRQIHR